MKKAQMLQSIIELSCNNKYKHEKIECHQLSMESTMTWSVDILTSTLLGTTVSLDCVLGGHPMEGEMHNMNMQSNR